MVFNKIQEYQDICRLIGQPKQDYQMFNHAYIIFQKEPLLIDSLLKWNKRTENTSYAGFRNYMREEYREIIKVGGLTIGSSNLNGNLTK